GRRVAAVPVQFASLTAHPDTPTAGQGGPVFGAVAHRVDANNAGGGSGESAADSSVTGRAPPTNRATSDPCSTRAGKVSRTTAVVSLGTGSRPPAVTATATMLPNRRPRSVDGSPTAHTCGKTSRRVAS